MASESVRQTADPSPSVETGNSICRVLSCSGDNIYLCIFTYVYLYLYTVVAFDEYDKKLSAWPEDAFGTSHLYYRP